MEIGLIKKVDIDHEMQQSYLDYAMSTIVARALPDARDGLKPVQRRILYGMYDMGLRADTAFKKSARIVGEVMGKYHPHGDQAVYEAMARMAQDFSMRYPLVDGQGNFGSVDGDPPAAMRYTEARLTPLSLDLLLQIDRSTVDFGRNFDDSLNEPLALPAALPNLLVNGASGIAVGMATSIPPHNLGEVIDGLVFMLERWEKLEDIAVDDLMKFIKGPDFPTGGIIIQENAGEDLLTAYATGRGRVTLRGKVQLEEMGRGKSRIIITELPYQINKASLIERIAELARENDLEGVSDLRDESDRQGMRIVIELNKVAEEEHVLRSLYRRTPLQTTFRISLLALVDGEPRLLSLKQALKVYLEHRIAVVRRRSEHDLEKARQRAHILEGLRVALQNLDEVIQIIRRAQDVDEARTKLMKRFKLSEPQTNAILEMPLRRLAALERKKIELEYQETVKLIKELTDLLHTPKKLRQVVANELQGMKQTYSDKRRTQIVSLKEGEVAKDVLTTVDLVPQQTVWVGVTEDGMIGRTTSDKLPRTSGKSGIRHLYSTNTHHTLYLAGTDGRAAAIAVQSLPEVENFGDGIPLSKASPLSGEAQLAQLFSAPAKPENGEERFVLVVTRNGMVKKSALSELPGPSTQLFTLVKTNPGDGLGWALLTDGKQELVLATQKGMMIRFSEEEVRPMGLVAAGVNGMKLSAGDQVIGAVLYQPKWDLLLVGSDGKGWRLPGTQIVLQGRYGQGTIACRPAKGAELVGVLYGRAGDSGLIHFKELATRSINIDQIPAGRRLGVGRELLPTKAGDRVVGVTGFVDGLAFWGQSSQPAKRPARERVKADVSQPELTAITAGAVEPSSKGRQRAVKTEPVSTPKTPGTREKKTQASSTSTSQRKPRGTAEPSKTARTKAATAPPEPAPEDTSKRKPRTVVSTTSSGTQKKAAATKTAGAVDSELKKRAPSAARAKVPKLSDETSKTASSPPRSRKTVKANQLALNLEQTAQPAAPAKKRAAAGTGSKAAKPAKPASSTARKRVTSGGAATSKATKTGTVNPKAPAGSKAKPAVKPAPKKSGSPKESDGSKTRSKTPAKPTSAVKKPGKKTGS